MGRLPLLSTMKDNKNSNLLPEYVWMIFVGMLLAILVLMHVFPAKASELSGDISQSSYILDSISDSGILIGSDRLVLAYDKYYNPSGNPTGSLSVTYPMSAGNSSGWTGTYSSTGFSRTDFSVVKGLIGNLDDSAHRVYISQDNWVQSLNLKSLNKEDDSLGVLYFDSFNNVDLYGYYAIESFGVQTSDLEVFISNNIIQVQGDAALYKWLNGSWVLVSPVISQNVMDLYPVSTVVKSDFLSVKLDGGSSVDIMCSKFSQDDIIVPDDPTPTSTPESEQVYSALVQLSPRTPYGYGSAPFSQDGFYLLDFSISPSSSVLVSTDSAAYSYSSSTYGVFSPWINNVILFTSQNTSASYLCFYFMGSVSGLDVYYLGVDNPSNTDYDYIRANYSKQSFSPSTYASIDQSYGISCFHLLNFGAWYAFNVLSTNYQYVLGLSDSRLDNFTYGIFDYNVNSPNNPLVQAYRYGLDGYSGDVGGPTPSPTPEPTATPEPTPSATPIPTPGYTVIIVTPVIPTPTPFLNVDIPSLPGGDLDGDTTDGILSTGFNFISNGGSSGLLSTAFSFIPDELQYLIWFLIFLLIILATLKIILHFGG